MTNAAERAREIVDLTLTQYEGHTAESVALRDELVLRVARALADAAEEISEWEALAALQRKREQPWHEMWRRETGKHDTLPDYGEFLGWLVAKIADAEQRAQRAEAQLKYWDDQDDILGQPLRERVWEMIQQLNAVRSAWDEAIQKLYAVLGGDPSAMPPNEPTDGTEET